MIFYGYSIQGKSHIKKGKVCQDANIILPLRKGWTIAAVADGVGSAKHSEDGSNIAVEKVSEYCKKHFPKKPTNAKIEVLLQQAYQYAMDCIVDFSSKNDGRIEDYDTTLSTSIYNGETVIWGHSGDGGIVVREINGDIKCITERQKGVDGISVIPLRGGTETWKFGIYDQKVSAVLLATDGVLDGVLMPYLLNVSNIKTMKDIMEVPKDKVYNTAAEFFMNPKCVFNNKAITNADTYMEEFIKADAESQNEEVILNCLCNAYGTMFGKSEAKKIAISISKYNYLPWAMQKVTDDKTIACMINDKGKTKYMQPEYYMEPDWEALQKKYEQIMYPNMYQNEETDNTQEYENREERIEKEKSEKIEDICSKREKLNEVKKGNRWIRNRRKRNARKKGRKKINKNRLIIVLLAIISLLVVLLVLCIGMLFSRERGKQIETTQPTTKEILETFTEETTTEESIKEKITTEKRTEEYTEETTEEETEESNDEESVSSSVEEFNHTQKKMI